MKSVLKAPLFALLLLVRTVEYFLRNRTIPKRFRHEAVPYFAQWESRELVADILSGAVKAANDPKWKASGAVSRAEYSLWSWTGCGMACLKMLLAHRNQTMIPLVELGRASMRYSCYDLPLETCIGLKYAPFVEYLREEFEISSKTARMMPVSQVVYELAQGNYVIASVHSSIRNPRSKSTVKGGHLVLMLGYDLGRQEFYLHNPSGGAPESEEYAAVSFKDFGKFFSSRGVVILGR